MITNSIRTAFAPLVALTAASLPFLPILGVARRLLGIQLSAQQMKRITRDVSSWRSCNLIVFGLGNDSLYWQAINRRGKTVFLENHPGWFEAVTRRHRMLDAHLVAYHSSMENWESDLHRPTHD